MGDGLEGYQGSNELPNHPKDRRKRMIAGVSDRTLVREKRKRPRRWCWEMDWKAKGMSGCVCRAKTWTRWQTAILWGVMSNTGEPPSFKLPPPAIRRNRRSNGSEQRNETRV